MEEVMREDLEQDELIDLGAASEVTRGIVQRFAEESTGLPDYRD
jgi:hypothetical protein